MNCVRERQEDTRTIKLRSQHGRNTIPKQMNAIGKPFENNRNPKRNRKEISKDILGMSLEKKEQ